MREDHITAVYTAGKAATTTTHRTLAALLPERVFDIRRGSPSGLEEYLEYLRRTDPNRPLRTDEVEFAAERARRPNARLRLVSLTREPVAAAVSSWFFNFENRVAGSHPDDWSVAEHVAAIADGEYASRPDYFTEWFTFECQALTDIDVYGNEFPAATGFQIYESASSDLLVIRSEDLNGCFQAAFAEFLTAEVTELQSHNVGEKSSYADAYRRFKEEARLPREFVERHHQTRYARHFYSPRALDLAHRHWTD